MTTKRCRLAGCVLGWQGSEGQLQTYLFQLLENLWGPDRLLTQYFANNPVAGKRYLILDLWSPTRQVMVEVKQPGMLRLPRQVRAGKRQVMSQIRALRTERVTGPITGVLTDGARWHSKVFRWGSTPWGHRTPNPSGLCGWLSGLGLPVTRTMTVRERQAAQHHSLIVSGGRLLKRCERCRRCLPTSGYHSHRGKPLQLQGMCKTCHRKARR